MANPPTKVYLAYPVEITPPAGLVDAILALLGVGPAVVTPAPAPQPVPAPSTFTQVGSGPAGCLCLQWAEDTLGFGGRYRGPGYLTADQAFGSWSRLGFTTANPVPGDLVFFYPSASNLNAGHVGFWTGPDAFTSLWCSGAVMAGPISLFSQQNGTLVKGYVSVAALR